MENKDLNSVMTKEEMMNKKALDSIVTNPMLKPKQISFQGTIPSGSAATFFYKADSLGVGAASTPNQTTGGLAFAMPTGYSVAVTNEFLKTFALVCTKLNINNSDSTQLGNTLSIRNLSIDGRSFYDAMFVSSAQLASNQNANLLNVGECIIFTTETFVTYPITAPAAGSTIVTITCMGLQAVPYAFLDAYLEMAQLKRAS